MSITCVLRFRDLVTEEGGSISEHRRIISKKGSTWWGWWMRQYETCPEVYFKELSRRLEERGAWRIYLLDSGESKIHRAELRQVLVAPFGNKIATPDASKTPDYYQRGKYPAWFRLSRIEDVDWHSREFYYESFPSRPERSDWGQLLGQQVRSIDQLRHIDATLWSVDDRSERG